jgi:hypothetical protein
LWFILLFGGRAVLDDFFNPNFTSEDEVNRCIKEVQNMSPRARSTLAVFYFWFNLERLGIKCVKSISVKTTYISTNLNLSVLPNFEGGEGSPYSEALRECMTGALPHFFSQNTIPGEYFRRIRHAIPYAVFSYWFGDFFKHVPENIQYKYSYCSEDEWPLMDKVFRSVFYGEPYCYDAVKCTFWDGSTSSGEMRDYNQNNSPLRFMELLGNSICSVDGTYLRGITARGYNSLSLSTHVPPDVDIAALNLLPVGMWKNDFSFDGVIARVAFDQTYKGAFLRDLEDRFIYLLKEENPVRDPQTNQVDLIFEERCEALKKAPSKLNCIGHVVDVLPPSFFPKVLWFKEFLQFPGEHLFVKTPKNQRGNPKNWSFNKWSALYYQGESDLLNTWIFNKFVNHSVPARALCHLVTCQNVFDIDDALSPIFVEKIPLDSPFMFGNTFVCIDDEPRWKVAVACGRQYSMLPPDAVDYEQFLAQSGLPLRSALLPIASAPPEGKPAMFAKQMFDSRLIKDLYDDIETVDKLYVRLLLLASDSSSMAEDWPGMPEATFTEFQERLKDNNRLLFDPEVFEYVLNYFFDSKAFEPKTRDLWRPYRFVFETLVGQALHEIGHSLLQYNDTKKKLYFASSDIAAATPKRILDFLDGTEMPALSGNNFENAEAESQAWTEAMERCKAKDAAAAAQAAAKAAARHKAAQEKADQAKAARAEAAQEKARQDKAARKKRDEERAASVKGRGGKLQPSRGPPPQKGGGKLQPSRGSPRKGP